MSASLDPLAIESEGPDSVLDDLVEALTARLQAGERVDLDEVARRYPQYAERLRRLLPALVMIADFRQSSPREPRGVDATGPGPGSSPELLGDFRILREVGRGGMGIVYEAEQVSLGRRVALKVLPMAAAMDSKQLQRFQLEAHAAACLHHTNIVPVHAVGCERGVPFYAMQYIEGRSLAQLITELRRLEGLDAAGKPTADLAHHSTSIQVSKLLSGRFSEAIGPAGPGSDIVVSPSSMSGPAGVAAPPPRPGGGPSSSSGSSTRSRAYLRTVAQLGVQVAQALDHAHTRGIVHRDIKPANLLLDDHGQLWVTDFGLAQIQGSPGLTLTGDVLGTLRYMSPEQALARRVVIDGRTDIYSLGVTLYELLTLRPAVDGRDRQEILRRIAEEDPALPRKLNPAVPRDLETILLKATAKEPSRRYATANELADELGRFLEYKPIKARRPSLLDRAAKWSRRHQAVVTTAAVVLVLGAAVSTWEAIRATKAEGLAQTRLRGVTEERNRTDVARQEAERRAIEAREVVDFLINDLIGAASPSRAQGQIPTVDQVLAQADQKIAQRFADRPVIEASIRHTLGQAYEELGQYGKAEQHAARAVELRLAQLGPEHADTIAAQNALGSALWQRGQHEKARKLMTSILASARTVLGPEHPEALHSMQVLAGALYGLGKYDEARVLHEELLAIQERVQGSEHPETLTTMHALARDWQIMGNLERAKRLHEQALAVELRGQPVHRETLLMMMHLASIYASSRQFDRALDLRRRAMDGCVHVLGPGHPLTQRAVGTYFTSARSDRVHGDRARKDLEPIRDRSRRERAPQARVTCSVTALCLALLLREQGRFAEARPLLEETLAEALRLRNEDPKLLDDPHSIERLRGLAQFLLGRWPGLAPGIGPAERPPASFTIDAPFFAVSPVADGRIGPDEYGPGIAATFDDDANPGRMYLWYKSRPKAPDDLSVRVHAAHTDRSLFLAFVVRDQLVDASERDARHPFFNDSVEVFINGDHVANDVTPGLFVVGETGNREGFQLIADAAGHQYTVGEGLTNTDWKVVTSRTADGYIIEFEIPLALIDTRDGPGFAPATSGDELLVNFGIIDNDDPTVSSQTSYAIFWAEDPNLAPYHGGEDVWTVNLRLDPKPAGP